MVIQKTWSRQNLYFVLVVTSWLISMLFAGTVFLIFDRITEVDQTTVGFIFLGNRLEEEYEEVLTREIVIWKKTAEYKIIYQEYDMTINLDYFSFELQETLNQITKNEQNNAIFSLSQEHRLLLANEINDFFTPADLTTQEINTMIDALMRDTSQLLSRKIYRLEAYLLPEYATTILDQVDISLIHANDVNQIVDTVNLIHIENEKRFSLLSQLSEKSLSNQQLSIIASGILGLSGKVNFNGFIFNHNQEMTTWGNYGMNVRILRVNQFDLTFYNYAQQDLTISIEKTNDTTLTFKLIGYPQKTEFDFDSVEYISIPFDTIFLASNDINADTENVIIIETETTITYRVLQQTGQQGKIIFFNRTIRAIGGDETTLRVFSEQYDPIDEIYLETVVDKEGV